MIFVRDKGQMCNNILQYGHAYAWAREHGRKSMSMRFAYKYQYFHICTTRHHNFFCYLFAKFMLKSGLMKSAQFHNLSTDHSQQEQLIQNHKNIVIEGWHIRYFDLFLKYKSELLQLFAFNKIVTDAVDKIIPQEHSGAEVNIGIHVRRGDYKRWANGEYYFDDAVYCDAAKRIFALFPKQKCNFYICGNDPQIEKDLYIKSLPQCRILFPNGNPGEDLCTLSRCDYLIGPPSSFSLVASMYGKARLHWIEHKNENLTLESFDVFNNLFRQFDKY